MDWFFGILLLILGACIGGMITLKYLEKSMDELIASYDNLVKTQDSIMKLDDNMIKELKKIGFIKDKLIALYEEVIEKAYSALIDLRDAGTENLDEVIGVLGEALDDHKEEDAS